MEKKGKLFFFPIECQLIHIEAMIDVKNHSLAVIVVVGDSQTLRILTAVPIKFLYFSWSYLETNVTFICCFSLSLSTWNSSLVFLCPSYLWISKNTSPPFSRTNLNLSSPSISLLSDSSLVFLIGISQKKVLALLCALHKEEHKCPFMLCYELNVCNPWNSYFEILNTNVVELEVELLRGDNH